MTARLACLLGFHAQRHHSIGGDALSLCVRSGCGWMRRA